MHFRAHGACHCSSRLALQWGETSAISTVYTGRGSFPIVIPPMMATSTLTMASADFCLMTPNVAIRCAFVSALGFGGSSMLFRMGRSPTSIALNKCHLRQISPDKDVNFCYTTAAFTLSPEPWASSCGANLPGDWALYAISVRRLIALHSGFLQTPPHGAALAFG